MSCRGPGIQRGLPHRDNTVNGVTNPARRGDFIVGFGTGFGAAAPDGALLRTVVPVNRHSGRSIGPDSLFRAGAGLPWGHTRLMSLYLFRPRRGSTCPSPFNREMLQVTPFSLPFNEITAQLHVFPSKPCEVHG